MKKKKKVTTMYKLDRSFRLNETSDIYTVRSIYTPLFI